MKEDLAGKTVGEYRILAPLGEGGMGVVYAAVNTRIDKKVAIKVLKGQGAEQDRLVTEAIAVNAVGHRNVVTIFGTGVLPDGRRYIVMEYLDGEPLDAYLRRKGTLPPVEVCELLQDVCAPLAAAHQRGIVHRDLKPANIFLVKQTDEGPFVKVLDFGLARQRVATKQYDESQTRDLVLEGTPEYMAPEQCTVQPIGAWTDLYAVGTIAYELLTGVPPFRDENASAIEVMTRKVRTPAPRLQPPAVPEPLAALVAGLLEIDPMKRPSSAESVRNQLRRIARMVREGASDVRFTGSIVPVAKAAPASVEAKPVKRSSRKRRSKVPVIVAGSAAVLLLGTGAVLLARPPPESMSKPVAPQPVVIPTPVPEDDDLPGDLPLPSPEASSDAGLAEAPRPRRPIAPSQDDLQRKLAAMEAKHQKLKDPPPQAKVDLNSFRVLITVASSPGDRTELMQKFVAWEKKYGR